MPDLETGIDGRALDPACRDLARACREQRFDDALALLSALRGDLLPDLIGVLEAAAADASRAGRAAAACTFADAAENGAAIYASWATSGGEGSARMDELRELKARLARYRA